MAAMNGQAARRPAPRGSRPKPLQPAPHLLLPLRRPLSIATVCVNGQGTVLHGCASCASCWRRGRQLGPGVLVPPPCAGLMN